MKKERMGSMQNMTEDFGDGHAGLASPREMPGVHDFKGDAHDIAYGASGMEGCKADAGKVSKQFKDYHWE